MRTASAILLALMPGAFFAQGQPIPFGSALDADQQIAESQQLAKDLSGSRNPQLRAKGDQHRTYDFPAAKKAMPYRLYVPTTWDGQSRLPLIVMLHGGGSDENRYMDMNNKQISAWRSSTVMLLYRRSATARWAHMARRCDCPLSSARPRPRPNREPA